MRNLLYAAGRIWTLVLAIDILRAGWIVLTASRVASNRETNG